MAELDSSSHKGDGKKRSKKMSTKIDMTPMVDLAFLLVTFFILTITFSKPKAMSLVIPDKKTPETKQDKVNEKEVMTIILGENNHIFYYKGIGSDNPKVMSSNYGEKGIRKVLVDFNTEVKDIQKAEGRKNVNGAIILIKPLDKSKYSNLVNILDEMKISGISVYALMDITSDEITMAKTAEANAINNSSAN